MSHRIARDCRGYYCLNCSWPGGDFCHHSHIAQQHADDPNGGA